MKINTLIKYLSLVSMSMLLCAYSSAEYSWGDSFEGFAGRNGTTINGTESDSGMFTWLTPSSFTVRKWDKSAYHRKNFLRITDDTAEQHTSVLTLKEGSEIPCPSSPGNDGTGGVTISFAFRRTAVDPGVFEAGLNIRFYFRSDDGTKSGSSGDYDLFKNTGLLDSKWYVFQGSAVTYHWNSTQTQPCVTGFKIIDPDSGEAVYSLTSGLPRANLSGSFETCSIYAMRFMTGSSGQAIIDIDDIHVGNYKYPPEPGMVFFMR